jgi:hypothetical protein
MLHKLPVMTKANSQGWDIWVRRGPLRCTGLCLRRMGRTRLSRPDGMQEGLLGTERRGHGPASDLGSTLLHFHRASPFPPFPGTFLSLLQLKDSQFTVHESLARTSLTCRFCTRIQTQRFRFRRSRTGARTCILSMIIFNDYCMVFCWRWLKNHTLKRHFSGLYQRYDLLPWQSSGSAT